jgi:hypothetical protein
MGKAIRYALNQWKALTRFLDDPRIPIDNNRSEAALRCIALGRKNYLHFGHDEAGRNFAMLYSLVSTCEANGVNPIEYLKDVLIRVKTHPASRIDELLPHRWRPAMTDAKPPSPPDGHEGGGPNSRDPDASFEHETENPRPRGSDTGAAAAIPATNAAPERPGLHGDDAILPPVVATSARRPSTSAALHTVPRRGLPSVAHSPRAYSARARRSDLVTGGVKSREAPIPPSMRSPRQPRGDPRRTPP